MAQNKFFFLDPQGTADLVNELETTIIAEEYSSSATYTLGNYCVHDNKLYKCITAITAAESWTSAHWTQVTVTNSKENLSIVCTQAQYTAWETAGTLITNVTYYVTDAPNVPETLSGLGDVTITSPATGQVMTYENGVWKNKAVDLSNYYTKSQVYSKSESDNLLSAKANSADLATVATSGSYNDLSNKPTIPSNLDELSDVSTTGKADGDSLVYNSTNSSWNPKATIVEVTQAQYDALVAAGTVDPLVSYYINDAPELQQPIIPPPPAANGAYYLKVTVNNSSVTYSWSAS